MSAATRVVVADDSVLLREGLCRLLEESGFEVVALLLGRRRREDPLESLTAREREVLGLMAEGRSNAAIAESLVVTERAVEKHVTSIFSKLDLPPTVEDHRRVLAVLAYLRAHD